MHENTINSTAEGIKTVTWPNLRRKSFHRSCDVSLIQCSIKGTKGLCNISTQIYALISWDYALKSFAWRQNKWHWSMLSKEVSLRVTISCFDSVWPGPLFTKRAGVLHGLPPLPAKVYNHFSRHFRTVLRQKGIFFNGRREFAKSSKKGWFFRHKSARFSKRLKICMYLPVTLDVESVWSLTTTSAARLPRCLSKFWTIRSL